MADVLNKTIKKITIDVGGLQINDGSGPYYTQITPSFPDDFHMVIGYNFNTGWDEHVRVYVLHDGIGFASDTRRTWPSGRKITVFYI